MNKKTVFTAILIILLFQNMAYAATEYISTNVPNTTVIDDVFLMADAQYPDSTDQLTSITVKYYCYPGDKLYIINYDFNGNEISQTQVPANTSGIYTYSPPPGTFATKLKMVTGNSSGTRYFWYSRAENNNGKIAIFDDPIQNIGIIDDEEPEPAPPGDENEDESGSGDGKEETSCNICVELGEIKSILNDLLSEIYDEITYIKSELRDIYYLVDINFQAVIHQLNDTNSTLNSIEDDTNDIKDTTHEIKDTVEDIYDYLSTPKDAEVYIPSLNIPKVNEPSIPERTKNEGEEDTLSITMPADALSPGPLPSIPEPIIMPHEEPREKQEPIQKQQPIQRQEPMERQYIQPQEPLSRQEIQPQEPLSLQSPLSPQTPLSPQAPLKPRPPLR